MKKKLFAFMLAIALMLPLMACGGESSEKESDSTDTTSQSVEAPTPTQDETAEPEQNVSKYDVDWDKCTEDFYESVLNQEYFPYATDVYVNVDEDKKQINFTAVLQDATDPKVALDYADTLIRQFNLMAIVQDSSIATGAKDYYGGLYDQYDILIGVSPLSKTSDSDEWFVFDAVLAGTHSKLELQKAYQ